MSQEVYREELDRIEGLELETSDNVCVVYIGDKGEISEPIDAVSALQEMWNSRTLKPSKPPVSATLDGVSGKYESRKSFENSNQSLKEIGYESGFQENIFLDKIQPTPYDPNAIIKLMKMSEVHAKCVRVKVRDSVARSYKIKSRFPIRTSDTDKVGSDYGISITEKEFQEDSRKIVKFIESCNSHEEFSEICYKVGLDKESIGWGAFEVIRDGSGKIARLQHIPATRVRVLEGFSGFVEEDPSKVGEDRYTFYQPFGYKVGKWVDDPYDLRQKPGKVFKPYDPDEDGELRIGNNGLTFNLIDKFTGDRIKRKSTAAFKDAANEILFIPNTDNTTIYYGITDAISALGGIIVNSKIEDYFHQFFEHNCVPRYVVIIKGATVQDEFLRLITDYFENKVKGSAHKTMILALTGYGNKNIEVEFKPLDMNLDSKDFSEIKKANDQRIMTAHGIPPAVLAINETANLGSGRGMSQADLYKNRVILPLQLYWASRLNKLFKLGLGCRFAKIEFDPMDIRDALQVAQALNLLLNLGVLTINEARRQLGMEGNLLGGDVAFVRIKEGSAIKVEDLPNLTTKLAEMGTYDEDTDSVIPVQDISIEEFQ
jgi:capsid portal protein